MNIAKYMYGAFQIHRWIEVQLEKKNAQEIEGIGFNNHGYIRDLRVYRVNEPPIVVLQKLVDAEVRSTGSTGYTCHLIGTRKEIGKLEKELSIKQEQ